MNVDSHTLLIIVCVAATTYATRLLGFYLLRNRTLSVRQQRVLEVMPGCVLISVIAPYFVPNNLADALAIAVAAGCQSLKFAAGGVCQRGRRQPVALLAGLAWQSGLLQRQSVV